MPGVDRQLRRHAASPSELKEQLEADRSGAPWLLYRDGGAVQRIVTLPQAPGRATIGRGPACDVCLAWDDQVSRVHAQLERLGEDWTIVDENLSRNGTFVNGERVNGRQRLTSGDVIRCGTTEVVFRAPISGGMETAPPGATVQPVALSDAQRRVLIALCRPFATSNAFASPPTNQEIADELVLSVVAIKGHLRTLFQKFGIEELSHNQKRAQLVALAFETGTVTRRDFAAQ